MTQTSWLDGIGKGASLKKFRQQAKVFNASSTATDDAIATVDIGLLMLLRQQVRMYWYVYTMENLETV
jgi:hypothetical protein